MDPYKKSDSFKTSKQTRSNNDKRTQLSSLTETTNDKNQKREKKVKNRLSGAFPFTGKKTNNNHVELPSRSIDKPVNNVNKQVVNGHDNQMNSLDKKKYKKSEKHQQMKIPGSISKKFGRSQEIKELSEFTSQTSQFSDTGSVSTQASRSLCGTGNRNHVSRVHSQKLVVLNDNQEKYQVEQQKKTTSQSDLERSKVIPAKEEDDRKLKEDAMKKEIANLENQIKSIRRDINEKVTQLQSIVSKLEINIRVESQVMQQLQQHYISFVPFVLNNLVTLTKKVEFSITNNSNRGCCKCCHACCSEDQVNKSQVPCSISINSNYKLVADSSDDFELVIEPLKQTNMSVLQRCVNEQLINLPPMGDTNSRSLTVDRQGSSSSSLRQGNCILGSKTIPYYLRNKRKTQEGTYTRSGSVSLKMTKLKVEDYQRLTSHYKIRFVDDKKRYLKLKNLGARRNTYPTLDGPNIKPDQEKTTKESTSSYTQESAFVHFCQSESELFYKFDIAAEKASLWMNNKEEKPENTEELNDIHDLMKNPQFRQLNSTDLNDLMNMSQNTSDLCKSIHSNNSFSVVLPRHKLSSLLMNNFTEVSNIFQNPYDDAKDVDSFNADEFIDDDYLEQAMFSSYMQEVKVESIYDEVYDDFEHVDDYEESLREE